MSRLKISPEIYVQWADAGLSNRQIATRLGVNESTVRRNLDAIEYQRNMIPVELEPFEERFRVDLDKPIRHEGDLMITADWHIPLYDPRYVNEMLRTANRESLGSLCIGGDFFNFDALSAYDPKQAEAGLERELGEAIAVMRVLLETFDNVYFIWGNHDARMHKALGYKIQFRDAMRMCFGELGSEALSKITFTNLDHMWVDTDETPWYICHPVSYSRTPLASARALISKVQANVITAHSHHCAIGHGVDGTLVAAEIGGLFDRDKTAYLQRSTTFPTWQQGYGWLKEGRLTISSPSWTTN